MASFSVPELFNRAFGLNRGKPYDAGQLDEEEQANIEYDQPNEDDQEGTEFLTVRNQLDARLPDGRLLFMPVRIGGVLLPNEPTLHLSKRKRIKETSLTGSARKGTVKELISSDDWDIIIRGIAVNAQSTLYYPEDQVAQLRELDAREEALEIECALTSLLGIYRLVIQKITFPEMIGIQHAQAYELKCISDEDFILEIE